MISATSMMLWQLAVFVTAVVAVVVAGLLYWLQREALAIQQLVAAIWQAGQRVANNTVHIGQLHQTGDGVDAILGKAAAIAGHAAGIEQHVASCPGCPHCLWRR